MCYNSAQGFTEEVVMTEFCKEGLLSQIIPLQKKNNKGLVKTAKDFIEIIRHVIDFKCHEH